MMIALAAIGLIGASPDGPTATVENGVAHGTAEGPLTVYRGIPYAQPPVGDLRWREPRPVRAGTAAIDARAFGAACLQPRRPGRERFAIARMDEDCLTLNLFAPAGGKAPLPVMVWFHGGAFTYGSTTAPFYDGSRLASRGVVVVTVNYRLGDLGFFAHPMLAGDGNFALLDQVAALRWIRRNVARFGGDPANVTVFGESAGGSAVLAHMVSPLSRGLFAKAIVQSGGGAQRQRRLAGGDGSLAAEGTAIAACLAGGAVDPIAAARAIPGDVLLGRIAACRTKPRGIGAYPAVGGGTLPDDVATLFAAGRQARVPLLIGANSFEGSVLASFAVDGAALRAMAGPGVDALLRRYGSRGGADDDRALLDAWGDRAFVGAARSIAARHAAVGQPSWLYHFSYVPARMRGTNRGASHGSDVPFVFGALGAAAFTDEDRALADAVMDYWVAFARSGDPNVAGRPAWPRYAAETDALLELGTTIAERRRLRAAYLD